MTILGTYGMPFTPGSQSERLRLSRVCLGKLRHSESRAHVRQLSREPQHRLDSVPCSKCQGHVGTVGSAAEVAQMPPV